MVNKGLLKLLIFSCLSFISANNVFASESGDEKRIKLPQPSLDKHYQSDGKPNANKVKLGRLLFFDKILSGNKNISCATCHHGLTNTGDGLSLPVGEGGHGLGVTRDTGKGKDSIVERVPRNAPPLFNLGAKEFKIMFHDGRVQVDPKHPSGFRTPAGDKLPKGLQDVLAAQAMFPVTSGTEMAGQAGENPIAIAAANGNLDGPDGVWAQLVKRIRSIPEYIELFIKAYPELESANDIKMIHIANAISSFEAFVWRADQSPFDNFLNGDRSALSKSAKRGMKLFYGKAKCVTCHSGTYQTDHKFHAIAIPQIGPGKGNDQDGHGDYGRELVTRDPKDRFRFRTPTLRNVALTGPWGHAGSYNSLKRIIKHHLDPVKNLYHYQKEQAVLPFREDLNAKDFVVMNDPSRLELIAKANELKKKRLSKDDIKDLISFLVALTDPRSIDLSKDVPMSVPSGLPLAE